MKLTHQNNDSNYITVEGLATDLPTFSIFVEGNFDAGYYRKHTRENAMDVIIPEIVKRFNAHEELMADIQTIINALDFVSPKDLNAISGGTMSECIAAFETLKKYRK